MTAEDDVGVELVWIVDPDFETVTAYASDDEPKLCSRGQELTAAACLPGLKLRVADLFE